MAEDQNRPTSNEETAVQRPAPEQSVPQVGEIGEVQTPADQRAAESVLEPSSEPADEEPTEPSKSDVELDGAARATEQPQQPVAAKPDPDPRSALEKQPYQFEQCTIQVAIQMLPDDGDGKGRPILLGLRSHLDAPIVQMLRANELGILPPAVAALIEQLKSELPAREQAAKERLAKAQEQAQRKNQAVNAGGKRGKAANAKPEKATAPAPKPSVLTEEQRAKAVAQVATDDKPQLALF